MSDSIRSQIVYFSKPGSHNTDELTHIVSDRLERGDIEAVVVATSTGGTALRFAEALQGATRIFAVNFQPSRWNSHSKPDPETRTVAEKAGVVFMPEKPEARYLKDIPGHSPDSFRRLGQGMKVAVEVVMQAVEVGHIPSGARVIGVGGTSRGADVAVVVKAAGPDELSKLWVSEILAKPL
jgi:hypothetical protein